MTVFSTGGNIYFYWYDQPI